MGLQERRQREGVAAVLDAEDAEQEAVEDEHDAGVEDDHGLLDLDTTEAGRLVGETNGAEGEGTVWAWNVSEANPHETDIGSVNVQRAPMICDSSWNWLWKPLAKKETWPLPSWPA